MAHFNPTTDCPITATLEFIGGRWKTVILHFLSSGTRRFGDIAARMPAISRKVLTEQLRELGRSLAQVLIEMESWGRAYAFAKLTESVIRTTD